MLHLRTFRECEGVLYINAQIANGALDLREAVRRRSASRPHAETQPTNKLSRRASRARDALPWRVPVRALRRRGESAGARGRDDDAVWSAHPRWRFISRASRRYLMSGYAACSVMLSSSA